MVKYDFFTGEPIQDGSPPSELSPEEIVQSANLTGYDYNANQRMANQMMGQQMTQQQQMFNPAFGYNYGMGGGFGYYPPQNFANFMNPPVQTGGFQGFAGNPAFQFMGANPAIQMQQPQFQDQTVFVHGFNPGNNHLLLPSDAEDICDQLEMEMMLEQEEAYVQRVKRQNDYYKSLGYSGVPNYYGAPYMNARYLDPTITAKYKKKIAEMRKEAEQARINLNKKLSRITHNYLEDEVDETDLSKIYDGRYVTIPANTIAYNAEQTRLSSSQLFDNSYLYQQHNAEVSSQYRKRFDDNTDMQTFFEGLGEIIVEDMMEEEMHRRRDDSQLFDGNGYRMLLRKKLAERQGSDGQQGVTLPNTRPNIPFGSAFPTLSQSATLLEDGSLSISAPSWLGNKTYVVKNQMEDDYELNRQKFVASIFGNTPSSGGAQTPPTKDGGK